MNTEAVVIKVAEALNVTIEPEDVEISHKLKRGKGIIVKFVSHKVKTLQGTHETQTRENFRFVSWLSQYGRTTTSYLH